MKKLAIAILTLLLSTSYADNYTEEVLSCKPKEAYACEPLKGCNKFDTPITEVIVDLKAKRYYRCDATGCDMRDIETKLSGATLYACYGSGAGTIRIATVDTPFSSKNEFMDNASLMFLNITMYGTCTVKED